MFFTYGSYHFGVFIEPLFICPGFSDLFLDGFAAFISFCFFTHSFQPAVRHSLKNTIYDTFLVSISCCPFFKKGSSRSLAGSSHWHVWYFSGSKFVFSSLICFLICIYYFICRVYLKNCRQAQFIKYLERHWVLGTERGWRAWATPTIWITRLDWQVLKLW